METTLKNKGAVVTGAASGIGKAIATAFIEAGIDIDSLAAQLQNEGAKSFVKSWNELMSVIDSAGVMLEKAAS